MISEIEILMREESSPVSQTSDRSLSNRLSARGSPDVGVDSEQVASPNTPSVFPSGVENDFLLDENIENESEPVKVDNKLSRRKTDRPRKRRRGSDDSPSVSTLLETIDKQAKASCVTERTSVLSVDSVGGSVLNLSSGHHSFPNSPESELTTTSTPSQQIPEDLSLRSDVDKRLDSKCYVTKDKCPVSKPNNIVSSSVHELEKAMNRHLPTNKKTFSDSGVDNHILQSQKSAIHWSGLSSSENIQSSFSSPFYVSNLYTSRESVIRSSLRSQALNGDNNVINMLSAPSGDVTINKEQLQLHIPHISVNTKHNFPPQKETVSHTDDFGMTPPGSLSPQEKMASAYPDISVARDCMGMRISQRHDVRNTSNKQFSVANDSNNDVTKSQYLSVPNYQYHSSDVSSFSQGSIPPGGLMFDPRNSPNNIWYGASYNS